MNTVLFVLIFSASGLITGWHHDYSAEADCRRALASLTQPRDSNTATKAWCGPQ